jgi:lipopolysaccharide transport system ATP-binding protein
MINVVGLAKSYRLGTASTPRSTFREALTALAMNPVKRWRGKQAERAASETFWALNDISFQIQPGEAVGLIGRNGAGKSTLLKILSRVTAPTRGRIELHGRVASLLEVGTGFHSELTGRENIFLGGVILGMRRAEVARKFDEIVAFAEIERFLDTQVKHYSSGMYMRLAFAVAAHMEPEILLVDEVLAVGDAAFQKRCLGKMDEVAKGGRTVIFVSHQMTAVTRLCSRAILVDAGRIKRDGDVYSVTAEYLKSDSGTTACRQWHALADAPGDDVARLKSVRVVSSGATAETVDIRAPLTIEMEFWNQKPGAMLVSAFSLFNDQGVPLFVSSDRFGPAGRDEPKPAGLFRSRCTIPGNLLAEGPVRVVAEVSTGYPVYQIHFLEFDAVAFQVVDTGEPGSVRGTWGRNIPGVVRPDLEWETVPLDQLAPE